MRHGFGLGLDNQKYIDAGPPFRNDLLVQSCPIKVEDGRIIDSSGKGDRLSVPSKVFNGDGTWYIRFADYISTAVDYYDVGLGSIVSTTTDVNGDLLFANDTKVSYILIDGHTFTPESISDPTSANQTAFASTNGEVQAQAYATSDTWVIDSLEGVADCDTYGCVLADGLTMYKDEALTLLYEADQPISALQLSDGSFSPTLANAWVSDGEGGAEHYTLVGDEKGRIQNNGRIVDGIENINSVNDWEANGATIDENSFTFTADGNNLFLETGELQNVSPNVEYTLAFDVLETTIDGPTFYLSSSSIAGASKIINVRTTGTKYVTFTSTDPIVYNSIRFVLLFEEPLGNYVKIGENVRLYRGTVTASNEPTSGQPVNGNSIIFADRADNPFILTTINEYINDIDYFFDITDAENYSANVVAIADMVNIVNNQYYFVFDDDGNLTCVLMYDEPKTGIDGDKIGAKIKILEKVIDSEGVVVKDVTGRVVYALKPGITYDDNTVFN